MLHKMKYSSGYVQLNAKHIRGDHKLNYHTTDNYTRQHQLPFRPSVPTGLAHSTMDTRSAQGSPSRCPLAFLQPRVRQPQGGYRTRLSKRLRMGRITNTGLCTQTEWQ